MGPGKFAAHLYGILADLADGQEVQPADVAFLDGADIVLFRDTSPPTPGDGIRIHLVSGQALDISVEDARHHVDEQPPEPDT